MKIGDFDIVFFDASNTLIGPHPPVEETVARVLRENGEAAPPVGKIRDVLNPHYRDAVRRINEGLRYCVSDEGDRDFWLDFYAVLMDRLGLDGTAAALGSKIYAFYQTRGFAPLPGAVALLKKLQARGVRMGMISNFSTFLRGHLERMEMDGFFDPVVISAELGCMKPDAKIFRIALDRAGVSDPARALLVGDNPWDDIKGARDAGMAHVLIDHWGGAEDPGCRVIRKLEELLEI